LILTFSRREKGKDFFINLLAGCGKSPLSSWQGERARVRGLCKLLIVLTLTPTLSQRERGRKGFFRNLLERRDAG
ncbi:MAG: hypothetical protein HY039_12470, partial [Nitrospirae bacterium]|nr:hypothetical protein [Nitrospirota bacterium]